MRVEPFAPAHLEGLVLQPHQAAWKAALTEEDRRRLTEAGRAWTGFTGRTPVVCAGLLDLGGGRAEAWALLGRDAGRRMTAITRAVACGLRGAGFRYVQAHTAMDFAPARRWVELLGFDFAAVLPRYCDDGGDAELWTRTGR
jgi:hypothetical protein